ncbi:apicomplexan specific protein [Cryptosporidium canis]|nr:apicomplexan specific protein [Cryptosporidium canis]
MTELSSDLYLKDENLQNSQKEEGISLIPQMCDAKTKGDIFHRNTSFVNIGDEVFMQLQTELFDILLEIYNLIPSWGSFKENFYFHWKRIIGACNFRDLNAYRLIFRCLGNLRPSSIPIFILRPIIRQLDEYRKISEPEYLPSHFEFDSNLHGNLITCTNAPFIIFQNSQILNALSVPVDDTKQEITENKTKDDLYSDKYNSLYYHGVVNNVPTQFSSRSSASVSETGNTPFSLFESDIINSIHQHGRQINLFDDKQNSLNCIFSGIRQLDGAIKDHEKSFDRTLLNNWQPSKELTFSDELSSEPISNSFISSSNCNSNSTVSSPYGSARTISSHSEGNIAGPIMATFHYIQTSTANTKNNLSSVNHSSNDQNTTQPKKRPRKNGEIQGVYFDKIRKLWRANWKENGRVKTKGFSVFQFGEEGARQKAIEYRKKMEKEFYVLPNSKVSKCSTINDTEYIDSDKALGDDSPTKKIMVGSNLNGSKLNLENTTKFSENSNSNLNN